MTITGMSITGKQTTREDDVVSECPICYEIFNNNARKLSCGHIFCHDCLVRTLVSGARYGMVTKSHIICPICRHLTFISKQNLNFLINGKGTDNAQTLEVPSLIANSQPRSDDTESALSRFVRSCTWLPRRCIGLGSVTPANTPQIFIISGQGRPMNHEDEISVVTSISEPNVQRRLPRNCVNGAGILALIFLLTLLAVIAAVLRWILLG